MSVACASGAIIRTRDNPSSFFMALLRLGLQDLLSLLDPGVDALLVPAGRARQADAADRVAADLDRHPAVDRDHVRQRGLLAPHRPGFHLLQEGLGSHPGRARGVGLPARGLYLARAGRVTAYRAQAGVAPNG